MAPLIEQIESTGFSEPGIARLLQAHLDFVARETPTCSNHALDLQALTAPSVTFWTARHTSALAGCVALKELSRTHGEIKSMHTAERFRGKGIARALMTTLIGAARQRGYERLSLETGYTEGFAASRALYESFGFTPCPPFDAYVDDPYSFCMTRKL